MTQTRPIVHHIPVRPFRQRLEILLLQKGAAEALDFCVVDITESRYSELLAKTRGASALPVRELPDGRILTPFSGEVLIRSISFKECLSGRF